MPVIVGVDPGVRCTLCRFEPGNAIEFCEETAVVVHRSRGNRTEPAPALIASVMRQWHPDLVIVEAVQPIGRKEGRARSPLTGGALMHARGVVEGICAGLGLIYELAVPSVWTATMKVRGGPEGARQRALQIEPSLAQSLARKSDHNRAAAYLLARWGLLTVLPHHPLF